MSAAASTRQQMLNRIRAATRGAASPEEASRSWSALPRSYIRRGSLSAEARIELMLRRLREYDAEVAECLPETLPEAIAAQLAHSGKRIFAAPAGLPPEWLASGFERPGFECPEFEWKIDHDLAISEIEKAEGVVTACFGGIADSGTLVLHHSATEGRRVLSLLPDWHLCILHASQVVETLPEYFSRCTQPPPLVTWISGPSATADIEMTRIKGVHGPRFLHVILVRDQGFEQQGLAPLGTEQTVN
jgi:L-lactate dehydrogenase complex protein LldG